MSVVLSSSGRFALVTTSRPTLNPKQATASIKMYTVIGLLVINYYYIVVASRSIFLYYSNVFCAHCRYNCDDLHG